MHIVAIFDMEDLTIAAGAITSVTLCRNATVGPLASSWHFWYKHEIRKCILHGSLNRSCVLIFASRILCTECMKWTC